MANILWFVFVVAIATCPNVLLSAGVDQTIMPFAIGSDVVRASVDQLTHSCVFEYDQLFMRRMAWVESRDGSDPDTFRFGFSGGIWQIKEEIFNRTLCGIVGSSICGKISSELGVNWYTVTWSDLLKPMYSLIAARLYIDRYHGKIPGDLNTQAAMWESLFHPVEAVNLTFWTRVAELPPENYDRPIDLAFVIDASGSITSPNYEKMKRFMVDLTSELDVSIDKTRIAVVRFASAADVIMKFGKYTTHQGLDAAIMNIQYPSKNTQTDAGLDTAREIVFKSTSGSRQEAVHVLLLITDGQSSNKQLTQVAAQKTRDEGIIIFSIGVGNANVAELNGASSPPQCTHVFNIDDFDHLQSLLDEIRYSAATASKQILVPHGIGHVTNSHQLTPNKTTTITDEVTSSGNGTGIVTSVNCGSIQVYISFTNPHPGPSLHDVQGLATNGKPSVIYVNSTGPQGKVYITYIGSSLPKNISECGNSTDFKIKYSNGKPKGNEVKCFHNGRETTCQPVDFLTSQYSYLMCKEKIEVRPPNPCTIQNLKNHEFYHQYPNDKARFIRCDLAGKMYISECPKGELYQTASENCGTGQEGSSPGTKIESWMRNPCPLEPMSEAELLYPHPDPHFYIKCDTWGRAWKVHCPGNYIWSVATMSCVEPPPSKPSPLPQSIMYAGNINVTRYDFECDNHHLCGLQQDHHDSGEWWVGAGNIDGSKTGPSDDHTFHTRSGHYGYISSSNLADPDSHASSVARLISPEFEPGTGYCLKFSYSMYGKDVRSLRIYLSNNGLMGYPIFEAHGNSGIDWMTTEVDINREYTGVNFKVLFEATTMSFQQFSPIAGFYYYHDKGDIAIDDILVFNTSCQNIPSCPSGSVVNAMSSSCYSIHSDKRTWYEAASFCRSRGKQGHLISINDANEQAFIANYIAKDSGLLQIGGEGFWTSGSDEFKESIFQWTDGDAAHALTYKDWKPGQPNDAFGRQDCLLLEYPNNKFAWGDIDCTERRPFICELEQDSQHSSTVTNGLPYSTPSPSQWVTSKIKL